MMQSQHIKQAIGMHTVGYDDALHHNNGQHPTTKLKYLEWISVRKYDLVEKIRMAFSYVPCKILSIMVNK